MPKGAKRDQQRGQRDPKGTNGCQGEQEDNQMGAKREPKEAKRVPRNQKGAQREPHWHRVNKS